MQYRPPTVAHGLGSTYRYGHGARLNYYGSQVNALGSAYGYHDAHNAGVGASHYGGAPPHYYGGGGQYYHNSAAARPYSATARRHGGIFGLDPSNQNPGNSMFVREDYGNFDDFDDLDDLDDLAVVPRTGAVTDLLKATKQGVSRGAAMAKKGVPTVVKTVRTFADPENANHHPALWKEYLANPNYTHDVEKAHVDVIKKGVRRFDLHLLYLHDTRMFSAIVANDAYGYTNWANPNEPKKLA